MAVDDEAVEVEILVSVAHALDDVEHQLDTFDVVADVDPRNWYRLDLGNVEVAFPLGNCCKVSNLVDSPVEVYP